MKTVRFSQVVDRSGRPHVHSLWVAPDRDAELKAAQKAQRVMMVSPPESGKADIGTVGFDASQATKGQLLIFPKSLSKFANARVVGVKFDLVDQPATHAARMAEALGATGRAPKKHQPRAAKATAAPVPENEHPDKRDQSARDTHPVSDNHPQPVSQSRAAATPTTKGTSHGPPPRARRTTTSDVGDDAAALKRVIRAALNELRDGKTVAAYQRLEAAIG